MIESVIRLVEWYVLVLVIACLAVGPVVSDPFSDVPADHWAHDAIQELVSRGILDGYPDGTFRGSNLVTRYALAVTLAQAIQDIEREGNLGSTRAGHSAFTESDMATFERLIREFSDELSLLGIKAAATEDRFRLHEREMESLHVRIDAVESERSGDDDRIFFDSGEMRIVGYNKEALDNFADTILNLGFRVDDIFEGVLGLRYTNTFDQNLQNDTFETYEAYADFANIGPIDTMRVGKANVLLGTGMTLFDRREGFILETERNDIFYQAGYFDARFFHAQTSLLGDAKVGFYYLRSDRRNDRAPKHLGLYAHGSAGDVSYQFELVDYDNDGISPGSALQASNFNDNTRGLHLGLSWEPRGGPFTAARIHYIDQEEDFRSLAIDSDLRYRSDRFSPLEDVLQAVRDATPRWVDPKELNGFTDFKFGVDFEIPDSPWFGRFDWDMVREHSSRLNTNNDEFSVLTLALSRDLRSNCNLELRYQSILFRDRDSSMAVDTIPTLTRQNRSNLRAQFFVTF